jgi:hypothetical protein
MRSNPYKDHEAMSQNRLTSGLVLLTTAIIVFTGCTISDAILSTSTPSATAVNNTPIPNNQMSPTPQSQPALTVYYYFTPYPRNNVPAGSVVIQAYDIVLAPAVAKLTPSNDVAADLRSALQTMMSDPRNLWKGDQLTISNVTFNAGLANVALSGKITGVGDIVLVAARMQFLMTIFANASIQTAIVTLNGENIANLGISHSSEAKPAGFAFTRAEIQAFMQKNEFAP